MRRSWFWNSYPKKDMVVVGIDGARMWNFRRIMAVIYLGKRKELLRCCFQEMKRNKTNVPEQKESQVQLEVCPT